MSVAFTKIAVTVSTNDPLTIHNKETAMEMYRMSEKIKRPDKHEVRRVIQEATEIHNSLSAIASSDNTVKQAIIQQTYALLHDSALREMALIGIDALNADKQGIRISALKRAGISNMYQVYDMSAREIMSIKGIGEQTAYKIKEVAKAMYNTITASGKIQINPQVKTQYQDKLVQSLYTLRNAETVRAQARSLLAQEERITTALQDVKPSSGFFKWLFSSKPKRSSSVEAYNYLADLVQGSFGDEAKLCITAYRDVASRNLSEVWSDFEKNSVQYYTLLENLGLSAAKSPAAGLPSELVEEIELYPIDLTHMKTSLRKYQVFGAKYVLRQKKALLGDEMGLGKTIQALAIIAHLKAKGETHFLVVCPASVLVNWKRETEKHTDMHCTIIHGLDKEFEFEQWKAQGGIGITNYESLSKLADKLDSSFGILVVDEAHLVKNPDAQRTKALMACSKRTDRILYMTGTPLENRVDEMCFLVKCLRPDIARKLSTMKSLSATQRFKTEIAPVYLRRVRDDVLDELPELIENEDWLEPTGDELRSYYNAVRSRNFMAMRRISWDVEPAHSSKAGRLLELCDQARDEGRKVMVFSFFRETLYKVCRMLGERALGPITGDVSPSMRQRLIDEFSAAERGKVLVAQVQAGGFGLNIQSASMVIFCEPQIKPSLETQAISRAYRMGQVRDVQVHRLLCVDTVDERMMEILQGKQAEFDAYADESIVGTESLKERRDTAWIRELVEQERKRIDALQQVDTTEEESASLP
jgi:SNF2 family DNA or RNA helicase